MRSANIKLPEINELVATGVAILSASEMVCSKVNSLRINEGIEASCSGPRRRPQQQETKLL